MDLCDKIEGMVKERKESIYSLEKELSIGNGTIGKWKGDRMPSVKVLKKLASHFGMTMEQLLSGTPCGEGELVSPEVEETR